MPSFASLLLPFVLPPFAALCWAQDPPPAPAQPAAPVSQPAAPVSQPAAPVTQPAAPATQEPQSQDPQEGEAGKDDANAADKPKRRGIAIEDPLVVVHCARCHKQDDDKLMTRISFLRKSPEGWSETIKRMIRLHGVQLSPTDAKQLVRSLANSNGLTRSEAERGLYESERRVHWSEESQDQDFRRACGECHPLGRVLLQQRDAEEWQLLRATHVAMFPLARGQMGGGPPEEEMRRFGGPGGGGTNNARGRTRGSGATPGGGGDSTPPRQGPTESVGDRVLRKLSEDQPLFTESWDTWTKNRRDVPLAGTWTVVGHETGRGDLVGTAELQREAEGEYTVTWRLSFSDGTRLERSGRGLLYAGYSWRGRSQDPGPDGAQWREVLLLDDAWQQLRGRLFTGNYDEIGVDVTLHRDLARPRVLAVSDGAIPVPGVGHRVTVHGEALPATLTADDFFVGKGLRITAVERQSDRQAVLTLDADADAELGPRTIAFGSDPGSTRLQLYDTVDYVRIRPLQGFSRVGGLRMPKQLERFEAFAMHRGPDGKPYTDDDVDLFQVRPRWALEEFKVRDDDDDLAYVGAIDAQTGVFTPNVDGPNPARKWQANNVGDVFVTATVELDVAVRPEKPKPDPAAKEKAEEKDAPAEPPPAAPLARERRTFLARSHLLVTVPLYTRWLVLDWEGR